MRSLQKKLLANDMDFQTCGQIMVAAKHNTYVMSCNYCQQKFAQIQTFLRHLQLLHTDKVEFGEKDKDVEVYAVEELMTTFSQTTTEEDCESEESGVAEEEDGNWLTEEDKKWLDEGEQETQIDNLKVKGLSNMSILKALEDCDVSFNFADNLDNTKCEGEGEKEKGMGREEEEDGEQEKWMEEDGEQDSVLNNTLLQEIQNDWNVSDEDKSENENNVTDLEGDVTLIEETKNNLRLKTTGLKGLLQGLEDLEDVDSLLENLEDGIKENNKPKVINLQRVDKTTRKSDSILETTAMDDLNFTLRVNENVPNEDNVMNFKLTKKSTDNLTKMSKNSNKTQQKMILNIQSGELEELETDSLQSEDSLEPENSINNNLNTTNNKTFDYDPEDSIMEEIKLQLNRPKETVESENRIINKFLNKIPNNNSIKSKIFKKSKEKSENSEFNDFDKQLKNLQESLQDEDSMESQYAKNTSKSSEENPNNTDSNDTVDFDMQLKNLEASLNEENSENIKSTAKAVKDVSQNSNKFSNMRRTNLMKVLDLELSVTEEDSFKEKSNKIAIKTAIKPTKDETLNKKSKSSQHQEKISEISKNFKETSSSVNLNDDLTKALAAALEGDDLNVFNVWEENDPPLNQHLQDLLTQELMEEESLGENIKQSNIKEVSETTVIPNTTNPRKSIKSPSNDSLKSRYNKTNLNAKNKQHLTKKNMISHILTTNTSQITFKTNQVKQNVVNGNHEVFLKQLENKSSLQQPVNKPKTPKKCKENQENLNINRRLRKTPNKLNPENLYSNQRLRKTPQKENQENLTPEFIKKMKKERCTPLQSFINTERGDKTPLKPEEIFFKNSPKTQEKIEKSLENFTPTKGETTPTAKEMMFLKQSPKTQEKQQELKQNKTPTTKESQILYKQSAKTQEQKKNENLLQNKTHSNLGHLNKIPTKKLPQNYDKLPALKTTKQIFTSPAKSFQENTQMLTPQRTKNVAIKLPRLTPEKLKQIQKSSNYTKNIENVMPQELKKSPLQIENKIQWNNFKLPNGITISKVSPSANNSNKANQLNETSTHSNQNYTNSLESQQPQPNLDVLHLIINKTMPDLKTSLVKPLKQENSVSKIRQRKASIDIITNVTSISQRRLPQQSNLPKTAPKLNNLDYKSYAVNRSARKKEVLQRMRQVKKQIFKSIENGKETIKINRFANTPPLNKQNKEKLRIENVNRAITNQFENFKKPFAGKTNISPKAAEAISPKNLNDDEKQAKKSLEVPNNTSPINDDEKLIKTSLKRPAISPIQGEQAKRLHKSPSKSKSQNEIKSSVLESTQLDLSESMVDFLQRDLKANYLNVDSFLNEDFPPDDNTPNETSIESNENDKNIQEKQKNNKTIDNSNILDDLLTQVDNEQKQNDEKSQHKKELAKGTTNNNLVIDFDEARDINLLQKFGLKIIKNVNIEDVIPLEEIEEAHKKAKQFAEIYRHYQRIWCSKNGENPNLRQELDIGFKQLLTQTNQTFNLELSLIDIKRLVNLISLWYAQNFNSKLIEKKNISEATNRYLLMFHYIPKTVKRFYYCEYCKECFTTEHKYFTHRIVHTGAQYPYKCSKCSMGFKILKTSKTHEQQCTVQIKNTFLKPVVTYSANNLKCTVCSEIFETSKLFYEHRKTHLKTVYNCVKCELVFASATDVQKHMTLCNRNIKRMPKQSTPRPTKPKIETNSDNSF